MARFEFLLQCVLRVVCVCLYLCVMHIIPPSHVWINWVWFNMVPTELLISVAPPLRLPVPLPLRLPSHCLWPGPCRVLSLPVGCTVCQA